jgi:hypothetical protein
MNTITQSKPGFIRDYSGNILLPITRAELVKNADGTNAFRIVKAHDQNNGTAGGYPGLMDPKTLADILAKIGGSGTDSLSGLQGQINKIKDSIQINSIACNLLDGVLNFKSSENISIAKDADNITFHLADTVNLNKATISTNAVNGTDVVNKQVLDAALDAKFKDALNVASGALHFKGGISKPLPSSPTIGSYYKVEEGFTETYTDSSNKSHTINASVGDTLIYAEVEDVKQWILIPSGNETMTKIQGTVGPQIYGGINITSEDGLVTVTTKSGTDGLTGTLDFKLNPASISSETVTSGYFNQDVYNAMKNLIPASVTYKAQTTSGYQIGSFGTDDTSVPVYIPKLVVAQDTIDGVTQHQIKYNGAKDAVNIKASRAIALSSDNNTITVGLNVANDQPLSVNEYGALALNVWKTGETNNPKGLITFETFASGLYDNVLFIHVEKPSQLSNDPTFLSYLQYTEPQN